jgi:DinB family protein
MSGTISQGPEELSRRAALRAGAAAGFAALLTLGHITPALADELARLAHGQPMTAARLSDILRAERAQWNELLAQVGLDRMEIPGVEGEWSVKDLVAHLTWYERAIVEGAQQVLRTGIFTRRRPAGVGIDEMNARIAAESRARPAGEVLAEADAVFDQLLAVVAACPEDVLNDPRRLGLPDDMVPWMGVANNSYAHYRQHEQALRTWLDRRNTAGGLPAETPD